MPEAYQETPAGCPPGAQLGAPRNHKKIGRGCPSTHWGIARGAGDCRLANLGPPVKGLASLAGAVRWAGGGQAEVVEDPFDDRLLVDEGDDLGADRRREQAKDASRKKTRRKQFAPRHARVERSRRLAFRDEAWMLARAELGGLYLARRGENARRKRLDQLLRSSGCRK